MKHLFCFLLTLLMIVPLAACGAQTSEPAGTEPVRSESTAAVTEPPATDRADIRDDLPEKDYKGAAFTIFDRANYDTEFFSEGETGNIRNDVIYRRNVKIEDRYKVRSSRSR